MPQSLPIFGEKLREMTGPYRARNWRTLTVLRTLDFIGHLLPKRQRALPADRKLRVLIINWGHLGDVVTLLPLIKFLEEHAHVDDVGVLTGSWARPVLENTNLKAKRHVLDHWGLNRGKQSKAQKVIHYFRQTLALLKELQTDNYDVSIETFSTPPVSNAVTWLAGIPCRIGFDSAGFGTLLTHPVNWLPADLHVTEQQLRLLDELPILKRPSVLAPSYPGFSPAQMPDHIAPLPAEYFVFHMGAGDPSRSWPAPKWVELGNIIRASGTKILFTGAPGPEAELAQHVCAQTEGCSVAGQLSWHQFLTVIAQAKAVISVDTVTSHLAACFSVPAVILTATRQRTAYWRPNNPCATTLSYPVGCAPCYQSRGCETMACINFIETSEVISTILGF